MRAIKRRYLAYLIAIAVVFLVHHLIKLSLVKHRTDLDDVSHFDVIPPAFVKKSDSSNSNPLSIAIGCAVCTRKIGTVDENNIAKKLWFFSQMLPSFLRTLSDSYQYCVFVTYDFDDPFLSQGNKSIELFRQTFNDAVRRKSKTVDLKLIKIDYSGKPAWAQNDALMAAYSEGYEYFYRINDDTKLLTSQWTEQFVGTLQNFRPRNVGMTGPLHIGGTKRILTYDFVHRTHITIHGFYYPREFYSLYADYWITNIYRPRYSKQLQTVKIEHTLSSGTRYSQKDISAVHPMIAPAMVTGKEHIAIWLNLLRILHKPIARLSSLCVITPCLRCSGDVDTMRIVEYIRTFIDPMLINIILPNELDFRGSSSGDDQVSVRTVPKSDFKCFPHCLPLERLLPAKQCSYILYWDLAAYATPKGLLSFRNWLSSATETFCVSNKLPDERITPLLGIKLDSLAELQKSLRAANSSCKAYTLKLYASAAERTMLEDMLPSSANKMVQFVKDKSNADVIVCSLASDSCKQRIKPSLVLVDHLRESACHNKFDAWSLRVTGLVSAGSYFIAKDKVSQAVITSATRNKANISLYPPPFVENKKYKKKTVAVIYTSDFSVLGKSEIDYVVETTKNFLTVKRCSATYPSCFHGCDALVILDSLLNVNTFEQFFCTVIPLFIPSGKLDSNKAFDTWISSSVFDKATIVKFESYLDLGTKLELMKHVNIYDPQKEYRIYTEIDSEVYMYGFWLDLVSKIQLQGVPRV